jgi:tetratricopeptide (TPR) repeat protein
MDLMMHPSALMKLLILLGFLATGPGLNGARKETWFEVKSPHFMAYSNAGESEARNVLKGFEGIRSVFQQAFPGLRVDPPKPMVVLVLENEAIMKRFLPGEFEGKDPARPAGYFISAADRNYAILRLDVDHQIDQPYFVLFHEYTHSIVHQNFAAMPTWLDEGIADFYGATEIRSDQVFLGRIPMGRLATLRESARLPLPTLLMVTHDSPHYREGEKTGMFYAQSWALVHYLFMDEQARKAGLFQAYLKVLGGAVDPLAAARSGLGDLEKLQKDLGAYSRRSVFTFWKLPLAIKLTEKDFQTRPLTVAEALVVAAEFLQTSRNEAASRSLLEQALALAPQQPEVQMALGYGHFIRGEKEQARGAFETSIQMGSKDFRAPYYLALLAQEHFASGEAETDRILGWLKSAQGLRPDFPGIHMALCRQYSWNPKNPTESLREGRLAIEAEPQNFANRANFGQACMNLDLEKEARLIGAELQRTAANKGERQIADSYGKILIQFLERRKAQAVLPTEPPPVPDPSQPQAGPDLPRLRFSLPSYLAPLGTEVMRLVGVGALEEAIQKVEKAIVQAHYAYDKKALRTLLATLRARRVGKHP